MLKELIDRTTRGAGVASVAAVALAAGIVVGGSALGAGVDQIRTVVAGGPSASPPGSPGAQGHGNDKADKKQQGGQDEHGQSHDKAAKPDTPSAGAGGVHGKCVSAVARDKHAVGGPHHNHGWAVSRAASSCPHPTPSASGGS